MSQYLKFRIGILKKRQWVSILSLAILIIFISVAMKAYQSNLRSKIGADEPDEIGYELVPGGWETIEGSTYVYETIAEEPNATNRQLNVGIRVRDFTVVCKPGWQSELETTIKRQIDYELRELAHIDDVGPVEITASNSTAPFIEDQLEYELPIVRREEINPEPGPLGDHIMKKKITYEVPVGVYPTTKYIYPFPEKSYIQKGSSLDQGAILPSLDTLRQLHHTMPGDPMEIDDKGELCYKFVLE